MLLAVDCSSFLVSDERVQSIRKTWQKKVGNSIYSDEKVSRFGHNYSFVVLYTVFYINQAALDSLQVYVVTHLIKILTVVHFKLLFKVNF